MHRCVVQITDAVQCWFIGSNIYTPYVDLSANHIKAALNKPPLSSLSEPLRVNFLHRCHMLAAQQAQAEAPKTRNASWLRLFCGARKLLLAAATSTCYAERQAALGTFVLLLHAFDHWHVHVQIGAVATGPARIAGGCACFRRSNQGSTQRCAGLAASVQTLTIDRDTDAQRVRVRGHRCYMHP